MAEPMRLQKYIARSGRASRREAERMMLAGRVSVNGEVVTELGTKIDPDRDAVAIDGTGLDVAETRWIVFHKPPGVLTTRSDPHGGRTVYDELPPELGHLSYIGRLDKDAEGLLLFTNAGTVAHGLAHPSGELEREYWLEVAGRVGRDEIDQLVRGVELDDGPARASRARVEKPGAVSSTLTLVLKEGRKREVRRMLSAIGHPVMRLRRIRFGSIRLDRLERGQWRDLTPAEIRALERLAG